MKIIPIHLSTPYSIYIGNNLLDSDSFRECCAQISKRFVIVTDNHLVDTFGKQLQQRMQKLGYVAELMAVPAGEKYKTRETKQQLEDALLEKQYGRDTCLIALGGGVVSDLVGFLAATYCRGIPVIYLPTTLLAMVDASIGGKTGVNTTHGKNLIGTFTQPHAVFIDLDFLTTLPEHEWQNGMAEMIKHSVIADAVLFKQLQQHCDQIQQPALLTDMIYASSLIKKNIVEQDETEQGLRQLLNFGHTIGHAIETLENYQISHGAAVAIGMVVESYLSMQAGFLPESAFIELCNLLRSYHLPLTTSAFLNQAQFTQIMMLDKKSIKNIPHFVLLDHIGKPHRHGHDYSMAINPTLLKQTLDWAATAFKVD